MLAFELPKVSMTDCGPPAPPAVEPTLQILFMPLAQGRDMWAFGGAQSPRLKG